MQTRPSQTQPYQTQPHQTQPYIEEARERAAALAARGHARILAIETSCDETSAAVVEDGRRALSNPISSQIALHAVYGGVVPEIASRNHVEAVDALVDEALGAAGMRLADMDAVAVTYGPGLVGAVLTGVSSAKALAYALRVPLVPVNHIEGHVCANYITHPDLQPPFVCLVVSGGHTHLIHVRDYGSYALLGRTLDDAAGEAFDKVARALGLAYPGGPLLDALAQRGDERALRLPRAVTPGALDFSFSGLKTAVLTLLRQRKEADTAGETFAADVAACFRRAVVDALLEKARRACELTRVNALAVAGGVAANSLLRVELARLGETAGLRTYVPAPVLCTDNAAMIGSAGYYRLMRGQIADLSLNAVPSLTLFEDAK